MPQRSGDLVVTNFRNGFITEANGLTFPEAACRDIDNVDLKSDGTARRRLGLDREADGLTMAPGILLPETMAGNAGGPLSAAGGTEADETSYLLDGTDLTGWSTPHTADTSVAVDVDDRFGTGSVIHIHHEGGRHEYGAVYRDMNLTTYDSFIFKMDFIQTSDHDNYCGFGLGVDSSGAGQYFDPYSGVLYTQTSFSRYDATATHDPHFVQLGKTNESYFIEGQWTRSVGNVGTLSYTVYDYDPSKPEGRGDPRSFQTVPFAITGNNFAFSSTHMNPNNGSQRIANLSVDLVRLGDSSGGSDVLLGPDQKAITVHRWDYPNSDPSAQFVVIQVGNQLLFRDNRTGGAVSPEGGKVPAGYSSLRFDTFGSGFVYNITAAECARIPLQSAVAFGRIWFTSRGVVPFYAELAKDGSTIQLFPVGYQAASGAAGVTGRRDIRDFTGVPDGLSPQETPGIITSEHAYNLLNQGWPSDKINSYYTDKGLYPSNAQQWSIGKDQTGDFSSDLLTKIDFGNSLAPRGRLVMDALLGSRDGVTHSIEDLGNPINFSGAYDERASSGWASVCAFAGRLWFAGDQNPKRPNCVYFSKTLQTVRDSGVFMQSNDPTSEQFSDLLANDGGVIPILEAERIVRVTPFGAGVLVFATNGVWFIYGGGDNGFTADSYSVEKISSVGAISAGSVVNVEKSVFFWAKDSIYQVTLPQAQGLVPITVDIAQAKILSYYTAIPMAQREAASAVYDLIGQKVMWLHCSDDLNLNPGLFNRGLILDLATGAFTKYSFGYTAADNTGLGFQGVGPGFYREAAEQDYTLEVVTDSADVPVTLSTGEVVTISTPVEGSNIGVNNVKLLFLNGAGSTGMELLDFNSYSFSDYLSITTPSIYTSFIETGDVTLGAPQDNKQTPYIHTFFTRTETGFESDSGSLVRKRPSGCMMYAKWGWSNTDAGNGWSRPQKAYLPNRRPYIPTGVSDLFDTGEEIVYNRLLVRGTGRAARLRFDSVPGMDFRLLGYAARVEADSE